MPATSATGRALTNARYRLRTGVGSDGKPLTEDHKKALREKIAKLAPIVAKETEDRLADRIAAHIDKNTGVVLDSVANLHKSTDEHHEEQKDLAMSQHVALMAELTELKDEVKGLKPGASGASGASLEGVDDPKVRIEIRKNAKRDFDNQQCVDRLLVTEDKQRRGLPLTIQDRRSAIKARRLQYADLTAECANAKDEGTKDLLQQKVEDARAKLQTCQNGLDEHTKKLSEDKKAKSEMQREKIKKAAEKKAAREAAREEKAKKVADKKAAEEAAREVKVKEEGPIDSGGAASSAAPTGEVDGGSGDYAELGPEQQVAPPVAAIRRRAPGAARRSRAHSGLSDTSVRGGAEGAPPAKRSRKPAAAS